MGARRILSIGKHKNCNLGLDERGGDVNGRMVMFKIIAAEVFSKTFYFANESKT